MANVQELVDEILAIEHYGVKGQKWGQRNYQNPDGTYTELGKKRRRVGYEKESSKEEDAKLMGGKAYKDMTRKERKAAKKRARHNEAERREHRQFNKDKEAAINKADLDFITKNIDKFTDDELIKVSERFKKIQMINEYNNLKKEEKARKTEALIDKGLRYLHKASNATDDITNISNKLTNAKRAKVELQKSKTDLQKAEHELDKLINPDKYEKKKTAVEMAEEKAKLAKAAADLQKAQNDLERDRIDLKTKRNDLQKSDYDTFMKRIDADIKLYDKDLKQLDKRIKEIDRDSKNYDWEHKDAEKTLAYQNNSYIRDQNYWKSVQEEWKAKNPGKSDGKKKNKNNNDDQSDDSNSSWINYGSKDRSSIIKRILGSDKIKDYEMYKPSKNRSYELDDLNKESQKAIKKIAKEKPATKMGDYAQDKQWTKDMKKHDSYVIDKWVADMKKKYIKERNMDPAAAEAKAEEYVDAWIDAYDEGKIKV